MRKEGSQRSGSLSTIQRQVPLWLKPVPQPPPSCIDHCPAGMGGFRGQMVPRLVKLKSLKEVKEEVKWSLIG